MAQPLTTVILRDEELVRSAQAGNLEAFSTLYERYLPVVFNRVRYSIPEVDVEDITQEVFIAVLHSLRSFRGEAQFSTWLRTLIKREVADYYRNRRKQAENSHLELDTRDGLDHYQEKMVSDPETGSAAIDERLFLIQAIRQLPEHYQEIIFYRFAEGLLFEEIAHCQGQSVEATKSLFRRAIAALQKMVVLKDG